MRTGAGGTGAIWLRSQLPMGRGLGYSGAVRVVGATLGLLEREPSASIVGDAAHRSHPDALRLRAEVLTISAALEGHGDNAAASVYGSVVAVADEVCVEVPLALDPAIVVWVPDATTGTDASRRTLPEQLSRDDAAFNVGRVAVLVAALGAGRIDALRVGAEDRMHQDHRLAHQPRSAATLRALLDAGAWSAWLSGSGPTVAAFAGREDADRLAAALPAEGRAMVLELDRHGVIWE
ncbi:MAG: hypothetical protein R2705_20720 [Ilumatobacteraceae bacterium]